MFEKILVANRGEIACRVFQTARRMGIRTVAVYSDADATALHVELADEALRIGPASAAESYLSIERIVAAALRAGAQAIHPGYGFLSENADFAEAVEAAGLVFIGPHPGAIRAMGRKDAAKALMERSGVPVVPGYHGADQDPEFLLERAVETGFPVLIKARAGGGGKGMRRVDEARDFAAALDAARREAKSAFGDDAVLIEKYLDCPRHIEVQVFGDTHGNVVHLFERDCSLQRRHQKVIEEAPAPGMTPQMRKAMGEAAVKAACAVGYRGAGTVEFIADVSGGLSPDRFFFMEMNTRLQVEHRVTEAITGLDLVEWQLRIAAGQPLPLAQADISLSGWAFEARLYAEDPARGFLPASGHLARLEFPPDGVRIDTGVRQADTVSPFYDPLMAKLIVHGPDRKTALEALGKALDACRIHGVANNLSFLARLSRQTEFAAGHPDTGLIDRQLDALTAIEPPGDDLWALASVCSLLIDNDTQRNDPWQTLGHWQLWGDVNRIVTLSHEGGSQTLRVTARARDLFAVEIGDGLLPVRILKRFAGGCLAEVSGRHRRVEISRSAQEFTLGMDGEEHVFRLDDPLNGNMREDAGGDTVISPMPGFVRLVRVRPGDAVRKGDGLIVLEAMKMEVTLPASRDGEVETVTVAEGDQTAEGAVLVTLRVCLVHSKPDRL